MAARRRSSASSRPSRSSSRTTSRAPTSEPRRSERPNREGKHPVTCPRCRAKYQVPTEYLDEVVTCKQCKTAFTPRRAMGAGPARPQGAGAGGQLMKVGFILSPFLLLFIIYSLTKSPPPPPPPPPPSKRYLSTNDEAFQVWQRFAEAVATKNSQVVDTSLDWEHAWSKGKPAQAPSWALAGSDRQREFQEQTNKELADSDLAKCFIMCSVDAVELRAAIEYPDDIKDFRFTVYYPDKERPHLAKDAVITAHTKLVGSLWKVHEWTVDVLPTPKVEKPKYRHPTLKAPKWEEVTIKGQTIKAYQGEPVPMPHLDETPPELRKEIDRLIDLVFTPNDADLKQGARSAIRLVEIGKAAAPRILNAFYERKAVSQFEREGFNILMKAFNNIAGANIDFLPDADPSSSFGGTDKDRDILMKAAFGHWYWNFWKKENELGGETDETLDAQMEKGPGKRDAPKKEEPKKEAGK